MKAVPLTRGATAYVDLIDAGRVLAHRWHVRSNGYAGALIRGRVVYLHRFILGEPRAFVDHWNGDRLDCRRHNLRITTRRSAVAKSLRGSSYLGVYKRAVGNRYWAMLARGKVKALYLGDYDTEEGAAKAYDSAVLHYIGSRAKTNFHDGIPLPQWRILKTGGLRGVRKRGKRWHARIHRKKRSRYIGSFRTEEKAARAYDRVAKRLLGDKARLNFP